MTRVSLAVIPARGGSKRVPGKNIRMLNGRPSLAYTIDAALQCGLFDRVVVSTDSEVIADVALTCGAEIPFLRDAGLADDYTPVSLVTHDALTRLDPDGTHYAYIAQLMANCPLRTADDILESYHQFVSTGADAQISITRFGWLNPWWAMRRDSAYALEPLFEELKTNRSQDLPEVFCPTGAIWWAKSETLRRAKTFHVHGRTGWEIPWQHAVDIDTEEDWQMAEVLMYLQSARHEPGRANQSRV
jgi:N-acylneuraminate cytidylyltransferase